MAKYYKSVIPWSESLVVAHSSQGKSWHEVVVSNFVEGLYLFSWVKKCYDVIICLEAFILFTSIFFQEFTLLSYLEKDWVLVKVDFILELESDLVLILISIKSF